MADALAIEVFRGQKYEGSHSIAMRGSFLINARQRLDENGGQFSGQPASTPDVDQVLVDVEKGGDPEYQPIVLGPAVSLPDLEGIQETECYGRPEILDPNQIEEHEPAVDLPYFAAQFANEMCFSVTRRANYYISERLVGGVRVARFSAEVVNYIVKLLLMKRRQMIGRIPPYAPKLSRPVEVDRT